MEIANLVAFSKSVDSRKAIIASGTDPWQVLTN
jgi:hypothetical protein